MEELKPCPFCGGKAFRLLSGDDDELNLKFCAVHCENCDCRTAFFENFDLAIQRWNRRANE